MNPMNEEEQKLADEIRTGIEAYAQKTYDDGHRSHLGASLIGHKCDRYLWFTFRWVYHHIHTGRMQRLFQTGHCEEIRIIRWLRGAGYQVENEDLDGKQFRISGVNGHFGGSIDGKAIIKDELFLTEFKTNKTGPEFKAYFEIGMKANKAKHWAQTCVYGAKLQIKRVLYICKNKDNDDLYIEIADLDHNHGYDMEQKANRIINSQEMPSRISETPAFFECKYCDYCDICHRNKPIEKNCRSCKNAYPVENAEWKCGLYNAIIPKDQILVDKPCWNGVM